MSLSTYVDRWSASEYSWCVHYLIPLQHRGLSGPQHEKAQTTPMICTVCSSLGTVSSLLSIKTSRQLASNHYLFTDLLHQTVVKASLPITSPKARSNASNGSSDFKTPLHFVSTVTNTMPAQRALSKLVRCFRKSVLVTLY